LQGESFDEWADIFFTRSIKLRPDFFLHYEYVGNTYLSAERFSKASECFHKAVALKPYVRSLRAKLAYCLLPENFRKANLFGKPSDLKLIFQTKQNYDDLGV